jgi:hypothetical protein
MYSFAVFIFPLKSALGKTLGKTNLKLGLILSDKQAKSTDVK